MILNVAITQSVGKHRLAALPRVLRRNVLKKDLFQFSVADWDLTLSCEGVPLNNDDESLAAAVRRVHSDRGNLHITMRPVGESGQSSMSSLVRRALPLADLIITATRRQTLQR